MHQQKKFAAHLIPLVLALCALAIPFKQALGVTKNGFELTGALIPVRQILNGGPPRDGIPALSYPAFVGSLDAEYLSDSDRVLGLEINTIAKAYPVKILNYHEIVNDRIGARHFVVSYCPLCGSGLAFDAPQGEQFGVSGLLYNSDVLLYDRHTESLWSQLRGQAVSGPLKGTKLVTLPLKHTTWGQWRREHADTLVLSRDTGYRTDYGRSPYGDYAKRSNLMFPVAHHSRKYHTKEQVLGVEINGHFKAYPFAELAAGESPLIDEFQGQKLTVKFDSKNGTGWVESDHPDQFSSVLAYWFAWYAFHPDTELWQASSKAP